MTRQRSAHAGGINRFLCVDLLSQARRVTRRSAGESSRAKTTTSNERTMKKILLAIIVAAFCAARTFAAPLGTGFTYQGRLNDGGAPANGGYDLLFMLYNDNDPADSLYFGEHIILSAVPVTNGHFTVQLNSNGEFGPLAFTGEARWLQIGVRSNPSANWTFLAPRQPLTPTPYALMARNVPNGAITSDKIANGAVGAQQVAVGGISTSNLAAGSITSDKLAPGSAEANLLAGGQSAVGSGGVILSEFANATSLLDAGYAKLTQQPIDLPTERWTKHPDAPTLPGVLQSMRRRTHTVVWTGTEWIIWGGTSIDANSFVNTGARYNPSNDVWKLLNTTNAPSARGYHSAVWTGTEMVVWGGRSTNSSSVNTGARYNPVTDSWTPLATLAAPAARARHFTVWTGSQMIIWGGFDGLDPLNSGARYNPANNTWSPMPSVGAPPMYERMTAVWAGNHFVVWGGATNILVAPSYHESVSVAQGARYNPVNNLWLPVTSYNAPPARSRHVAVSSGSEMVVFGGLSESFAPGNCNPTLDDCSYFRSESEMNDGGRYNPVTDTWIAWLTSNSEPRVDAYAVSTGDEMIVLGGHWTTWCDGGWGPGGYCTLYFEDGLRYRFSNHAWSKITNTVSTLRNDDIGGLTLTWGASKVLFWGGDFSTGDLYDPTNNTWSATTQAPSGDTTERTLATIIWTGKEMIIWGGVNRDGAVLRSGLSYNPAAKTWKLLNVTGAPSARRSHTAIWTGTEMIIFGGITNGGFANTGGRYNPITDSWTPLPANGAPAPRQAHTAVWTGNDMVVWGGSSAVNFFGTGARFNPASNTWMPLSDNNAPTPRHGHTAVWTGSEMIVWGGFSWAISYQNSGARYNPATDSWTPTSVVDAPVPRTGHYAAWSGSEMLVWGGSSTNTLNSGGRYNPVVNQWTAMSTYNAPSVSLAGTAFTGTKFIVWGGMKDYPNAVNTGAAYDLEFNAWTPTLVTNNFSMQTASYRYAYATCWTGSEMLIWGGMQSPDNPLADTHAYAPARRFYLYLKP
jgi:N-acetylneuraminic acid mutarotase